MKIKKKKKLEVAVCFSLYDEIPRKISYSKVILWFGLFFFQLLPYGKIGKENNVPYSYLCVQPSVLHSVVQKENCFPAHNKDAEQALLHDITLALKGLVLCLCRTEAEAGASGIHLAVPIITHDSDCTSSWQPHLGGPGVKTIPR